jgi:hypothetical protein
MEHRQITAKIAHEFRSAWAIQFRVFATFFENIEGSEDKALFQYRTDFSIIHESFHFAAGRTPGSAEHEKDGFMLENCG